MSTSIIAMDVDLDTEQLENYTKKGFFLFFSLDRVSDNQLVAVCKHGDKLGMGVICGRQRMGRGYVHLIVDSARAIQPVAPTPEQ